MVILAYRLGALSALQLSWKSMLTLVSVDRGYVDRYPIEWYPVTPMTRMWVSACVF